MGEGDHCLSSDPNVLLIERKQGTLENKCLKKMFSSRVSLITCHWEGRKEGVQIQGVTAELLHLQSVLTQLIKPITSGSWCPWFDKSEIKDYYLNYRYLQNGSIDMGGM